MDTTKLKTIRKGLKITITELSKQSGVDRSLISEIENNKANPTIKTLEAIADALGVQIIITL